MRPVSIIGVGLLPVTRGAHRPASELAAEAVRQALADTGGLVGRPDALVVGNMMSGLLSDQTQLGALVADRAGFRGVEAVTVEAACASGAAAVRQGLMAVASGLHRAVVVVGVETMTHTPKERTTHALATASDWAAEGAHGETFVSLNARLMAAYMAAYGARPEDFAPLALTAHDNACDNPLAVFHKRVTLDDYLASREIVPPVRLYDASPMCDGAAALVLADAELASEARRAGRPVALVRASAAATDALALADRRTLLALDAAAASARRAYDEAGIGPDDVDLFELHDAYTVISALSLEAAGFAPPGRALALAAEGAIGRGGRVPIATMGGLKGRGHPVGATGLYQIGEAALQLSGRAGACQVRGAALALCQNVGGTGATVVTHVLEAR